MKASGMTYLVAGVLAVGLLLCGTGSQEVLAAPPGCGAVLTGDTVLDGDMSCAGAALIIGADGITVDLGGHTLSSLDGTGIGVDNTGGFDDVTIKNGSILGFSIAVRAEGADGLTLQDLTITGGPDDVTGVVHVLDSTGVTVKDSSISGVLAESGGVVFNAVRDGLIDNVQVDSGFVCVAIGGGSEETGLTRTSATVKGCTLTSGAPFATGVLVAFTDDATVKENTIHGIGPGAGIWLGSGLGLPVSGARVEGNEIFDCEFGIAGQVNPGLLPIDTYAIVGNHLHDNSRGLLMNNGDDGIISQNVIERSGTFGLFLARGSTGNVIAENTISDNGVRAIVMLFGANDNLISENICSNNGVDGISLLIGANTGNVIQENVCLGNGRFDMFHNVPSTPNTWTENTCGTSSGADIDCP